MSQLRELLPLVREKCNGMLDQEALDQLKKAYRVFCLKSGYLQQTLIVSRNNDGAINLAEDLDHYIGSINVVIETKGNRKLEKGAGYKVDSSNKVTVAEGYDEVSVTFSIVPLLPMDNSFELNDEITQRWSDEIASGAASLLRLIPDRSWTNPSLADYYQRDFVKGHREAFQLRVAANDEIQLQSTSNRIFI